MPFPIALRRIACLVPLLLACARPDPSSGQAVDSAKSFIIVAWNVESGGADPDTIAARIRAFDGVDLWGLSEVAGERDARRFQAAAGEGEGRRYGMLLGRSGDQDRLLALYDEGRFELLESEELEAMNPGGRVRAPLVARLRERQTGLTFLFMVNHLYRSRAELRLQQARQLNDWVRRQDLPVVAVGDFNFDWEVVGGDRRHNDAYDAFVADGQWRWLRPAELRRTQCSLIVVNARPGCKYDSVLDFVFISASAAHWSGRAEIVPDSFPDDQWRSDHRPVRAVVTPVVPR